jgi:hypothetical protein
VLQALEVNWRVAAPTPLHYRLLNPLLWRWSRPAATQALPPASQAMAEEPGTLVQHPALASWYLLTDEIFQMAETLMLAPEEVTVQQVEQATWTLAKEVATSTEAVTGLCRSLESLREWLVLAGDWPAADEAAAIGADLMQPSSAGSLAASQALLAHLCLQGLRTAMVNLTLGLGMA